LRHPSFQGLRPDKKASESVRETPAAELVTLTSPDKELFPGVTKKDVADYYSAVAAPMIDVLGERPISFVQYHKGIGERGIFRQNLAKPQPWMHIIETATSTKRGSAIHLAPDSADALRWLAQNNALEIHMWSSREGRLDSPDWVVFDLDPVEKFSETIEVAHTLRRFLEELSLPSLPKTSGKRGLHVFVPLAPGHTFDQTVEFALKVGESLSSALPQITLERAIKNRRGRLYFDCLQNGWGKTVIAPYSLRAVPGAQVSTPLEWSEVTDKLDPASFTWKTVPKRLEKLGDLFTWKKGARLPKLS
jgi:bifunctional non-homologous end joining protein LigD